MIERRQLKTSLGSHTLPDGNCFFRVWAPEAEQVNLELISPVARTVQMNRMWRGYWGALVPGIGPGADYMFRVDGGESRPDPASRSQPASVHGASRTVDQFFPWSDHSWFGIPLSTYVLYELHVGTYTPEGTFEAIIPHLATLRELGVTALELMPVAQFPGERNWGYDGVYLFAVQQSYGGLLGLKKLVDAAHVSGIAVVLDVVYNHLGPEGNYLETFGPYFTDKYKTPWGASINFDGPHSDEVRHFFFENARYWIEDCHVDGLRLDATHLIMDTSAVHFLQELAGRVHALGERLNRRVHLFAESDANDVRWVRSPDAGGLGFNAQWNDDFQHALFTILPGADASAYRGDYGEFWQLTKAYEEGFVYSGQYSPYRKRRHGNSSRHVHGKRMVVFMQNHDQVGNRPHGDRLCQQLQYEGLKLAAAAYILSPFIPLLFMGEEYAEDAPFLYFVSHSDPTLIEAVRKGRREEFAHFLGQIEPPDPQDPGTFQKSQLNLSLRSEGAHAVLWRFYRELLSLRRSFPALASLNRDSIQIREYEKQRVLMMLRSCDEDKALTIFCFSEEEVDIHLPIPHGKWTCVMDSSDVMWNGSGGRAAQHMEGGRRSILLRLNRQSVLVYSKDNELPEQSELILTP